MTRRHKALCKMEQLRLIKMKLIMKIESLNTLSSAGLLGNERSDITATLCLIHWLRYLIMFWYSTHLISTSCWEKHDHQQQSANIRLGGANAGALSQLTLGLIPSTPSGTLGKASYSVETYVMTDFSSGDWTSTSDGGRKDKWKSHKCTTESSTQRN